MSDTESKARALTTQRKGLLERMADRYGLEPTVFERTVAAVAMPQKNGKPDCSKEELISCLIVANEHDLNPLTREIYFMRTKSGVIQPIVGVDGWVKKLNSHPSFNGLGFEDVLDDRGNLISVTCVIHMKGRDHPTKVTEYMEECRGGSPAWQKSPRRMLRHRALTQGARYAVGFAGVMDIDEFERWQSDGTMRDITPAKPAHIALDIPDIPDEPPAPQEQPRDPDASPQISKDHFLAKVDEEMGWQLALDALNEVHEHNEFTAERLDAVTELRALYDRHEARIEGIGQ